MKIPLNYRSFGQEDIDFHTKKTKKKYLYAYLSLEDKAVLVFKDSDKKTQKGNLEDYF